jgi:hypothetical protein
VRVSTEPSEVRVSSEPSEVRVPSVPSTGTREPRNPGRPMQC